MGRILYTSGEYLKMNPGWHSEDSEWKAEQILCIMKRNGIRPGTVCEVGCGSGEILVQLSLKMDKTVRFTGYEISPQAFELCKARANDRLQFYLGDFTRGKDAFFDVILLIDVIEHVQDYFGFLAAMKNKGKYKILHIPLDLSVQSVLRGTWLTNVRQSVGHIHYFTKDVALAALKDVNYEIIDYAYTGSAVELPAKSVKSHLARWPRKMLFQINQDFAARLLGGYSLMALAR